LAATSTAELRGQAVHVMAEPAAQDEPSIPLQAHTSAVILVLRQDANPPPGSCIAAEPAARDAYAILAARPVERLAGTEFLVDPEGWLCAVRHPGSNRWSTRDDPIADIRSICTSPINPPNGGDHDPIP
jgi:hypothetical protein